MTTEEKAKAYEMALERAKNLHKDAIDMEESLLAKQCEIIFPELKENKREWIEKIRQELKSYLAHREVKQISESDACLQWITWLEKQGKLPVSDIDEQMISKIKFAVSQMPSERQDTKKECLNWLEDLRERL